MTLYSRDPFDSWNSNSISFPPPLNMQTQEEIKTVCGHLLHLQQNPENKPLFEETLALVRHIADDPTLPLDYKQTLDAVNAFLGHLENSTLPIDAKRAQLDELHVTLTGFLSFTSME
mgnify:CR=1 FL=1